MTTTTRGSTRKGATPRNRGQHHASTAATSAPPREAAIKDKLTPLRRRVAAVMEGSELSDIEEIGAATAAAVAVHHAGGAYASTWQSYVKACSQHGKHGPTPMTTEKVQGWLTVKLRDDDTSSASLPTMASRLRQYAAGAGVGTEDVDWPAINKVISLLRRAKPAKPVRKAAVLPSDALHQLKRHVKSLEGADRLEGLQVLCMMMLASGAGLRGGEYTEGRLKACDVQVLNPKDPASRGIGIDLVLPKNTKMSLTPQQVVVSEKLLGLPIVRYMLRWCAAMGLRMGDPTDDRDMFPRIGKTGQLQQHSYNTWRTLMRRYLQAAGVPDAHLYTPHSLRHQARTRYADKGIPISLVHSAAGWRSSASHRYDRRTPANVLKQLESAANTTARRHSRSRSRRAASPEMGGE